MWALGAVRGILGAGVPQHQALNASCLYLSCAMDMSRLVDAGLDASTLVQIALPSTSTEAE